MSLFIISSDATSNQAAFFFSSWGQMAHFLCAIWYNSLSEALQFCLVVAAAVVQEFLQLGCTLDATKNLYCSRVGHLASLFTWLQKKKQKQETNVLVTPSCVLPAVAKPCFASWGKTTKRPPLADPLSQRTQIILLKASSLQWTSYQDWFVFCIAQLWQKMTSFECRTNSYLYCITQMNGPKGNPLLNWESLLEDNFLHKKMFNLIYNQVVLVFTG